MSMQNSRAAIPKDKSNIESILTISLGPRTHSLKPACRPHSQGERYISIRATLRDGKSLLRANGGVSEQTQLNEQID